MICNYYPSKYKRLVCKCLLISAPDYTGTHGIWRVLVFGLWGYSGRYLSYFR